MERRLGLVTRYALVGLFALLSLFGMPALAYFSRPERSTGDVAVELVLPADHVL